VCICVPATCCRSFSFGCGCNFYRIGGTGSACPSVSLAFSGKRNASKSKWPTSIYRHIYTAHPFHALVSYLCTFAFMRTLHFFAWWGLLINHFVDFQFNFLISLHILVPGPPPPFWTWLLLYGKALLYTIPDSSDPRFHRSTDP